MVKSVFYNMVKSIGPNFKAKKNFSVYYCIIYFLAVFPVLMLRKETPGIIGVYYTYAIPFVITFIGTMVCDTGISKTMFLLPMDLKTRRKYVINGILVKIAVESACFIIGYILSRIIWPNINYPLTHLILAELLLVFELNMGPKANKDSSYNEIFGKSASAVTMLKIVASALIVVAGIIDNFEVALSQVFIIVAIINFVLGIIYIIKYFPITVRVLSNYDMVEELEKKGRVK